ncbi:NAD(P)-dependent oxidoreductase [Ramlibacter sp. AN1015]|uniref:NAD(P)-dependent oxidoreductase n=1 Tax=Ramlibacter sp. AN1015 TaxID=3133428 RepID=UPI0030C5EE11
MRVHVVGVGKMGLPMARHLGTGGHSVGVSDPDPQRLALAGEAGLAQRPWSEAALAGVDVVLSSLPHDQALRQVGDAVARWGRPGLLFIDTSTVSPQASAEVARSCEAAGVAHLRCTVSGNNQMAEAAQLTVMGSGPASAWERALPLLRLLGPTQLYLGEGEQARLMKLVVNLMIAQTSAMLAEALALGRKGGLEGEAMWRVFTASAVASPILRAKADALAARDFTPTFTVHQMIKDLDLILGAAQALQVPLAQTALTRQWMSAAVAQGDGGEDYAAILKVVERSAGLGADGTIAP